MVKQGVKIKSKLHNRGLECLPVGHAEKHAKDIHGFLEPKTNGTIRSRDVKWLNKMFDDCCNVQKPLRKTKDEDNDEDSSGSDADDKMRVKMKLKLNMRKKKRFWTQMPLRRMNLMVLIWWQGE